MQESQISAYISETTRREVEQYAESHGVKKGYLVEQALLHHLQALKALPADLLVPAQLRLSAKSFDAVVKRIARREKPTRALKALLAGKPVAGEP